MPGQVGALFLQVPAIALIIWMVLHTESGEPNAPRMFYFVISLSALWLGMMNACMEIAREAVIYRRERMIGLELNAYLLSKFAVLSLMGALQCGLLVLILEVVFKTKGHPAWHFAGLTLTCMAASGVGLLISAAAMSVEKAIAMVPMLILVHFLFSSFFMDIVNPETPQAGHQAGNQDESEDKIGFHDVIEKLSIATWSLDFLLQEAGGPDKFPAGLPGGGVPQAARSQHGDATDDDEQEKLSKDQAGAMALDAAVLFVFMAAHLILAKVALRLRETALMRG